MKSTPGSLSILLVTSLCSLLSSRHYVKTLYNDHTEHRAALFHNAVQVPVPKPRKNFNLRETQDILFVHVGRGGGVTIAQSSSIGCTMGFLGEKPESRKDVELCLQGNFGADLVLPYKVTKYMHKTDLKSKDLLDPAVSFLFALRDPVERYISGYRYGHPSSCNSKDSNREGNQVGCATQKIVQLNKPNFPVVRFYQCFPTLEDLAKFGVLSSSSPAGVATASNSTITKTTRKCNRLARECATGTSQKGICGGEPHKSVYNLQYYMSQTVDKYPDRPILAIRTEHAWEDLVELDQQLGGTGYFKQNGLQVNRGAEATAHTSVSPEGYHKLCCVLVEEIEIYRSLLLRAANLKETVKRKTLISLYDKCGIKSLWPEWRASCQQRLDLDAQLIPQ